MGPVGASASGVASAKLHTSLADLDLVEKGGEFGCEGGSEGDEDAKVSVIT